MKKEEEMTDRSPCEDYDPYELRARSKVDALGFLQSVYNDQSEAKSLRVKAAIEALRFERPALAVTATIEDQSLAKLLDERIKRNAEAMPRALIEATPAPQLEKPQPVSIKSAPMVPDRRFRRA